MISVRDINYYTEEESDKLFSRLTWAVEKVDTLTAQLITNFTVDTNRPWVGTYDKGNMRFRLIEPGGFFNAKLFQIIVSGQITKGDDKTILNIKIGLGLYTAMPSLMMYMFTTLLTALTILNGQWGNILSLLLWILFFPGLWTLLLYKKLNKIETKVEELFKIQ